MQILKFTHDHEWILYDPQNPETSATVGITDYAQDQLGDIVYVEVPESGLLVKRGQQVAVIESVKTASEVFSPIDGRIDESNLSLEDDPGQVNADPLEKGWLFKITPSDLSQLNDLMDQEAYHLYVEGLA